MFYNETSFAFAGIGNEYGITNVSSHGRVNITVIPPNKLGMRAFSPPLAHTTSPNNNNSTTYTTHHKRYLSSSGSSSLSPRSPPPAPQHLVHGSSGERQENTSNVSTVTTRTIKTSHDSTRGQDVTPSGDHQHLQSSRHVPN